MAGLKKIYELLGKIWRVDVLAPLFCIALALSLAIVGATTRSLNLALLAASILSATIILVSILAIRMRRRLHARIMEFAHAEEIARQETAAIAKRAQTESETFRSESTRLVKEVERKQARIQQLQAVIAANSNTIPRTDWKNVDPQGDLSKGNSLLDSALHNLERVKLSAFPSPPDPAEHSKRFPLSSPQVSVIVPMFNEAAFVTATIESLQRQTFTDFEVIVVDDASTDGSMAVAIDAAQKDDRFRFLRHAHNSGLSAARNTGLRAAQAPLVTFLDSDDLLFPEALEVRVNKMRELESARTNRAYAGVWCRLITMPQNITLDEALRRHPKRNVKMQAVDFVSSAGECPFNAHSPMLFTDVVKAHGGFDEKMRFGCEDWDLWQRIMRNGYAFAPTNNISGVYRRKRGSMVKETPVEHLAAAEKLFMRARGPVAPEDIATGAPYVFSNSIEDYQKQLHFLRRTAQFAAINAFASKQAFDSLLDKIPTGCAAYLEDERDLLPFIEAGIRRAIALDEPSIDKMREKFDRLTRSILSAIHSSSASEPCANVARDSKVFDAVFFPQTQAQAKAMIPAAQALRDAGKSVLFVTTETQSGDQGERAALDAAGVDHTTFNRTCLTGLRARAAAIMRPYSSLIRDAIPQGASIVELADPTRPISPPDENVPRDDIAIAAPSDAAATLLAMIENAPAVFRIDEGCARTEPAYAPAPAIIAKEESFHQSPDHADLTAMKDKWRGQRCVIIGNGPSINQTDLTKLKNEFTFAVNGIFYKSAEMGFDPTFYVVEDSAVMKENIDAIKTYRGHYKLFPTLYRDLHPKDDNVSFFTMNRGFYEKESPHYCIPRFSTDASQRVFCGQSVTHINLQLAYYFGFAEVYLIGVDFSYVIPNSAIRKGDLITSTEDDPNHFHRDYFGKGKTWKDPKLHRVKLNYELARDMFAADGRKVLNATKGGALEVFERADYDSVF